MGWDSADRHLCAIKPKIAHWQSAFQANRRWETILCRLRIGHTRLTHGYHMSGAEAPICEHCPGPPRLTVKHILITCMKDTPLTRIIKRAAQRTLPCWEIDGIPERNGNI